MSIYCKLKISFFFFIANQLSILHYNERPHNLLNLTWVHRPLIVHDVIPRFVFYFATFYLSPTCFLDISTRMSVCACVCVCFLYTLCVCMCACLQTTPKQHPSHCPHWDVPNFAWKGKNVKELWEILFSLLNVY